MKTDFRLTKPIYKKVMRSVSIRCDDGAAREMANLRYRDVENALERLAAYEDSGLTPEEVEKIKSELILARMERDKAKSRRPDAERNDILALESLAMGLDAQANGMYRRGIEDAIQTLVTLQKRRAADRPDP